MSWEGRMIASAFAFAARAHAGQKREDMGDDYINHLAEVAGALADHHPFDPFLVTAGILHDTVEDTAVTNDDIRRQFGPEVADIVFEVTDPPGMKKAARRARQVDHVATASRSARLLKLADKTSNVAELADAPKKRRSSARTIRSYVNWSRDVVAHCRGLDEQLEAAFDAAASRAEAVARKQERREAKAGKAKP